MHIIIVGGGKTGSYIARLLARENHSIKVIEQKKTAVAKLANDVDPADIIRELRALENEIAQGLAALERMLA